MGIKSGKGNLQDRNFFQAIYEHTNDYNLFVNQTINAGLTLIQYENIPDTINVRYIEKALLMGNAVVFFQDDIIGKLCLKLGAIQSFDVYGEPSKYGAFGDNGYFVDNLNTDNSVIMYNNLVRNGNMSEINWIASMLYDFDRIIKVNANAQKTPLLIKTDEKGRLTLLNVYKKWEGDEPVIFADKNFNSANFDVLNTNAPFIADKLYNIKRWYKQEMLTLMGIPTYDRNKTERLLTDELTLSATEALSYANSKLMARQQAIDKVNQMWGTEIKVKINPLYVQIMENMQNEKEVNNE